MTVACRRCKADIESRLIGGLLVWQHRNRAIDHPALPPVKVAEPSESEKRAIYGDR